MERDGDPDNSESRKNHHEGKPAPDAKGEFLGPPCQRRRDGFTSGERLASRWHIPEPVTQSGSGQ
jgi:hypothetical protein